jgi:hypothetical protein
VAQVEGPEFKPNIATKKRKKERKKEKVCDVETASTSHPSGRPVKTTL